MVRLGRVVLVAIVVACASPMAAASAQVGARPFLDGLAFPTNMAFLPDGTLLYTEKETGAVRVVTPAGELLDRPFVTVPVVPEAERGLLGIAVHPDFEREPWVYLYLSDPADGRNRLVRVPSDGHVAAGAPEPLLDGLSASAGYHNGGDLVFAPDGTLFIAIGEAHEPDRAQDPDDIGGKIVRLEPDGSVPDDNPFGPDNPAWSIGHRNSFGLCIDPETGDLWETENGPDRDDEVNLIERGANYGWPIVTGAAGDDRFVDPRAVFPRPIAVTGCAVVDGDLWFGSFDGRLWRMPTDDPGAPPQAVGSFPTGVTDVVLGPDGNLYMSTADSIAVVRPGRPAATPTDATATAAEPSPTTASVSGEPSDGPGWRGWVAAAAVVVLGGALAARFVAGRRLRDAAPDPSPDPDPGSAPGSGEER